MWSLVFLLSASQLPNAKDEEKERLYQIVLARPFLRVYMAKYANGVISFGISREILHTCENSCASYFSHTLGFYEIPWKLSFFQNWNRQYWVALTKNSSSNCNFSAPRWVWKSNIEPIERPCSDWPCVQSLLLRVHINDALKIVLFSTWQVRETVKSAIRWFQKKT